jgi:hypothetical protein
VINLLLRVDAFASDLIKKGAKAVFSLRIGGQAPEMNRVRIGEKNGARILEERWGKIKNHNFVGNKMETHVSVGTELIRSHGPFVLSLSFDFAQDIREKPIVVSLSNHGFSTKGIRVGEDAFSVVD